MTVNVGLSCLLRAMDHFLFIFAMSVTTTCKSKSIPFPETNEKVVQTVSAGLCCYPNPEYLNTIIRQYQPKRGIHVSSFPTCGCFCYQLLHLGAPFPMSNSRLAQASNLRNGNGGISAAGLSEKPFRCCNCYSKL